LTLAHEKAARQKQHSPLLTFNPHGAGRNIMTRVDLIRLIGDVLRQLDVLKNSQSQHNPSFAVLTEVRNTLAKQQLKLAISDLDEKTPEFLKASEDIMTFNSRLQEPISSKDAGVALVNHLTSFAKAVDTLVEGRHSFQQSS